MRIQMYDERFVSPMREELTQLGVHEMRTPEEVDEVLRDARGRFDRQEVRKCCPLTGGINVPQRVTKTRWLSGEFKDVAIRQRITRGLNLFERN